MISDGNNFFYVEGLQKSVFRKFKRGHFPISATCDLHGYRYSEALEELEIFLKVTKKDKISAVLLIHGKGLSSIGKKPVLKPLVKEFLLNEPKVLAFSPAPKNLGGEGATLALLSRS